MLHFSRLKTISILVVTVFGILLALPNFLPQQTREAMERSIPRWASFIIPTKAMVLGLDLQGGSHVLLEVDVADLTRSQVEVLRDDVRRVLRENRIPLQGGLTVQQQGVTLRVANAADRERILPKLRELSQPISNVILGQTGARNLEISEREGAIQLTITREGSTEKVRRAVEQTIEILRRRVDALGTTEPNIQRQGVSRVLVQVPGLQDPTRLKELLGRTAKLTFRMVDTTVTPDQAQQGRVPIDSELLKGSKKEGEHPYVIEKRVVVSGEDLTDAQPGFDQRTSEPIVTFRFNTKGSAAFGRATQENVGRPFAIVLDNEVISAPVIREPIIGGSGQISGNFTVEQANDLAILLRAGALPAKLTIIEERTVGPSLGRDSIEAGTLAAYIGGSLVAVFMIAVYGLFGFFALAALAINILLLFGIQSALQATLTLPGIAGIVLTIGMAVDSNVVIFERIRDEFRQGRSAISAIDKGFSLALGTVMDANMTAFFCALLLFAFGGSGPVRGFAVTFIIGLVTTAFTAYTVTRLMIATWVRWTRPVAIPIA